MFLFELQNSDGQTLIIKPFLKERKKKRKKEIKKLQTGDNNFDMK